MQSALTSPTDRSREEPARRKYDGVLIYQNMTDQKQFLIRNLFYQSQQNNSYEAADSSLHGPRGGGVPQNLSHKFRAEL